MLKTDILSSVCIYKSEYLLDIILLFSINITEGIVTDIKRFDKFVYYYIYSMYFVTNVIICF